MSYLLIWWTNQADCEAIDDVCPHTDCVGHLDSRFPEYLRAQYRSRYGRNGRGRLWVDDQFSFCNNIKVDPWPNTELGNLLGEKSRLDQTYAGIVILAEDAPLLDAMPGIITTLRLRRWRG